MSDPKALYGCLSCAKLANDLKVAREERDDAREENRKLRQALATHRCDNCKTLILEADAALGKGD